MSDRSVRASIDPEHVTSVQQVAVTAMQRHDLGEPGEFRVVEDEQVPLEAEMTEERRGGTERERVGPPGRVAAGWPDVRAHHLRRDQRRSPPLDRLAFESVVAVARPHPFGPFEDPQIDPPTARGTTLDLHVGMGVPEQIEEAIDGERLGMGRGASGGVAARDVHPVHVPFEEGDVVIAQQVIEPIMDRGERVGSGQVEHELVASEHRFVSGSLEHPIGVGAVEVAVGADHLRFDPQSELHAETADVGDQRGESLRMRVRRHPPVAERCGVVAATGEPTVVEHEPLGSDPGGAVGELPQPVGVVIEVHRLPRVHEHRAGPRWVRRQGADVAVIGPARVGEPRRGVGAEHGRRRVGVTRLEDDLARPEQLAGSRDAATVGQSLDAQVGVAAPREMEPPDLAVLLAEPVHTGPGEGRVFVRAASRPVLHVDRAAHERLAVGVQLAAPTTVERDDVDGVRGERNGHVEVRQRVRRSADVRDPGRAAQQTAGVEFDRRLELEAGDIVTSDDREATRVGGGRHQREPRRPTRPVGSMAGEPRPAGMTRTVFRHERHRCLHVEGAAGDRPMECSRHGVDVDRAERRAPVQDLGAAAGRADHDADVTIGEVHG